MARVQRLPAVLVMAEYGVGDSPLWWRGPSSTIGMAFSGDLRLSPRTRSELDTWNQVFDDISTTGFEFPTREVEHEHRVRAFELASTVQQELGEGVEVWCGAGEGVDDFPRTADGERLVVLRSATRGSTLIEWSGGRAAIVRSTDVGVSEGSARDLAHWRSATSRSGSFLGSASTRADGLWVAASVQRDLGLTARVLFFGGAPGPG